MMKQKEIESEEQLMKLLESIPYKDDEHRNEIVCGLIGHSDIMTTFFGYHYCGRCEQKLGDSLASFYFNERQVLIGHNCDKCRENYEKLSWKDKVFTPDPFVNKDEADEAR